jgi:hypothetical protein
MAGDPKSAGILCGNAEVAKKMPTLSVSWQCTCVHSEGNLPHLNPERWRHAMIRGFAKIIAAALFVAAVGAAIAPAPADAGPTKCYKCTGGWCCY